jgi:hypothetical protein
MPNSKNLKKIEEREEALSKIIGKVCIYFGRLEESLSEFIELLTPLEPGDISRSITSEMDIRSKIQTIRALAYIRKPSEEWFSNMMLLMDYIDNDLRPRRNRYIHDGWYLSKGSLLRRTNKIKILKPQSFQLQLQTRTEVIAKIPELKKLETELKDLVFVMFAFWYDYAYPEAPRVLPLSIFRRFLRRAKPNTDLSQIRQIRQHPK